MPGFTIIWSGQFLSMLGSGMTRFALIFWLYGETGSATSLGLLGLASFAPTILLAPFAGILIDRISRSLAMALSDLGAVLGTACIFVLYIGGSLETWHLYALGIWSGTFESMQWPAYAASVATMVEKKDYARANGLLGMAGSASMVFSPMVAAFLLKWAGLTTILTIDLFTFVLAVLTLVWVRIPNPERTSNAPKTISQQLLFGFNYILKRKSLLYLQFLPLFHNFFRQFTLILLPAMILARTDGDILALGTAEAALGIGGAVGGIVIGAWGGPKKKIHIVFLGRFWDGLLGQLLIGVGQTVSTWSIGCFLLFFSGPVMDGCGTAIWQSKVPPDIQGKVFAARRMIAHIIAPFAMLIAGVLADSVFEPNMAPDRPWTSYFGWIVGTGPGSGMALIMVLSGIFTAFLGVWGYLCPSVRLVEDLVPDYDSST